MPGSNPGRRRPERRPARGSNEFAQVLGGNAPRNVLKDDIRVDESETPAGEGQWRFGMGQIATVEVRVECFCLPDHGGGNVDAHAIGKAAGERLGEPAHAAAEVECFAAKVGQMAKALDMAQNDIDLELAGSQELREVPATLGFGRVGQDRMQRIALGERLPIVLQLSERGHREDEVRSSRPFRVKMQA